MDWIMDIMDVVRMDREGCACACLCLCGCIVLLKRHN